MTPPTESVSTAPASPDRLTSWKAIAAYLQCNERTVKRWEQERALPVHRLPGGKRGGVFAYRSELDGWLRVEKSRAEELPAENIHVEDPADKVRAKDAAENLIPGARATPREKPRRWFRLGLAAAIVIVTLTATFLSLHRGWVSRPRHVPAPGAEELYFRGRYFWNLRTTDSLRQAVDAFTQAIVKDPSYAEAYAGLAEVYDLLPEFGHGDMGGSLTRAINAADRAIQLDPYNADAHRARAFAVFYWNWDIPGSDAEFRQSLALNPDSAQTHQWYASTLQQRLEGAECVRQASEALRLNPTSPAIAADAALFRAEFVDYDAGIRALRDIERTQPTLSSPAWFQRNLAFCRGEFQMYIDAARRYASITHHPDDLALADAVATGWRNGGRTGLLEARAVALKQSLERSWESSFALGQTLILLGRPKEALPFFRVAFEGHSTALITMEVCPWAKALANDPGYAALFAEVRARLHGGRPARPPVVGVGFRLPQ